ncbi:MAG: aldehyde dehydrogenase family protein [Candidatus Micrarchaeota archaeon]|nr:aldehyde dehydrogenase family protein [Candidatus Micrarchaeota archaeon]
MKGKFTNESTYKGFLESGKEEEFDRLFDQAAEQARKAFGAEHPLYIGGAPVTTAEKIVERSPIDSAIVIGTFQKAGQPQISSAIKAAQGAFLEWSQTDYKIRASIFRKAAGTLSQRKFEIAAILSYENGKTRYESIGEVDEGIDFMRYYAYEIENNRGFARKKSLHGKSTHTTGFQGAPSSEKVTVSLRPYGVFAVIAPFNFPISISIGMSTGTLMTGNTVVFKPSSTDNPAMLSGLKIYQLFRDAGVPSGAFNYITSPGSAFGEEITRNQLIRGVAFTGSRAVGTELMRSSIASGQHAQFIVEMSGKNPAIVCKSADLDAAANGIASAAFGYCGQKCSALSRLYVHESIKEALTAKIIEKARGMKIGNPMSKEVYIGPLIGEKAKKRYMESIAIARQTARILYGGSEVRTGLKGCYVEPAIIEARHDNQLVKSELFVPILTIESFKTLDEAIRLANDTEFGLTAGFYSKKRSEVKEFISKIEAGVVYTNREASATTGAMVGIHTFVGWKASGLTGKGTGSRFYLPQFMREQSVSEMA